MKKGAALSLVLAPGGTAMFWVTQAGWARAAGMRETTEINAPAGTPNTLRIFASRNRRVLVARLHGKYVERTAGGQVAAARRATSSIARRRRSSPPAADLQDSREFAPRTIDRAVPANWPRPSCGRAQSPRARLPSRGCDRRAAT